MFGLKRSSNNKPLPKPFEVSQRAKTKLLPEGLQLVAREDVFSLQGDHPVLLIRAGKVVGEELFSKLVRYGVNPEQFVLKPIASENESPVSHAVNRQEKSGDEGHTTSEKTLESERSNFKKTINPMTDLKAEWSGTNLIRNKIVIYEPDARSLKRIVDGLVMSGVYLGDIYPVRTSGELEPSILKHEPIMVFVDPSFHVETSLFPRLKTLRRDYGIEHILLTLSVSRQDQDKRNQWMDKAERSGIDVLFKPMNPFALTPYVDFYKTRQGLRQDMTSH